jgi:hypothetical protein
MQRPTGTPRRTVDFCSLVVQLMKLACLIMRQGVLLDYKGGDDDDAVICI